MTNYPYPAIVLPPRKVTPEIVPATTGGGRAITAVEDVVSYDAGYWQIDLQEIPVASRQQKLAWRAMAANLNGRVGLIDVPCFDLALAPLAVDDDGNFITWVGAYFTDDTGFDDGTSFDDGSITANIAADAAEGAVSIQVFIAAGAGDLMEGMDFSVLPGTLYRLYRVAAITDSETTDDGTTYTVTILPPLREAITSGLSAELAQPLCTCRLADDQQMRSGADDYAGRTLANLSFVEAVNG